MKKIKALNTLFLIILANLIFAQDYGGFLSEVFFRRLPSARADALGGAISSVDGDLSASFLNPASSATIKGLNFEGSGSSPYFAMPNTYSSFYSLGYKLHDKLIVSISRSRLFYDNERRDYFVNGDSSALYRPQTATNSLNISSQPIKNLLIGITASYLTWQSSPEVTNTVYFNLGIIKKFNIGGNPRLPQNVNVSSSIVNLNSSEITIKSGTRTGSANLPVIMRLGANYQIGANLNMLFDTLKTISAMALVEYRNILDSELFSAGHTGAEISFLEMLHIRLGYFYEKLSDFGLPEYNQGFISTFTYGFGLQAPLSKISQIPLDVRFDYTSFPQPSASRIQTLENFTTYNLIVNWVMR